MADAATRWISPYFQSEAPPNFARVWVLNPGMTDANVVAHWSYALGGQVTTSEQTISHGVTGIFGCPVNVDMGWLRIVSDTPVVPWGTTPFNPAAEELGFAPMSFYREEVLQLKSIHLPPGL